MPSLAFMLIVASALMHALYNLFIKRSSCKTVFIWWMFVSSTALFTLMLPFLPGPFPCPDLNLLILCIGGAFCFVLYHLFLGRAYQSGDLSLTYPLSQTALFYVPFWGFWLFNEQLSLAGLMGIICVGGGGYLLQIRRLTLAGLVRPFGSLVEPAVQAALAAGFVYSLGAIIDKIGVTSYPPIYFTYFLILFMLLFMTMNLLRPCYRAMILPELRENRRFILASGPVMMGSFLTFRFGLALAPMSYAVTVRQVSVLVGVIIGVLFLKESCGRIRFTAALMILAGVALIRLS
jgi:drug/metabolite transporter (DMT)-like permease